jgi:hypothetical protein
MGITDGMPSWGKSLYVIFIILFREKKEKKELPSAPSQGKPINPAARTACRTH